MSAHPAERPLPERMPDHQQDETAAGDGPAFSSVHLEGDHDPAEAFREFMAAAAETPEESGDTAPEPAVEADADEELEDIVETLRILTGGIKRARDQGKEPDEMYIKTRDDVLKMLAQHLEGKPNVAPDSNDANEADAAPDDDAKKQSPAPPVPIVDSAPAGPSGPEPIAPEPVPVDVPNPTTGSEPVVEPEPLPVDPEPENNAKAAATPDNEAGSVDDTQVLPIAPDSGEGGKDKKDKSKKKSKKKEKAKKPPTPEMVRSQIDEVDEEIRALKKIIKLKPYKQAADDLNESRGLRKFLIVELHNLDGEGEEPEDLNTYIASAAGFDEATETYKDLVYELEHAADLTDKRLGKVVTGLNEMGLELSEFDPDFKLRIYDDRDMQQAKERIARQKAGKSAPLLGRLGLRGRR